MRMVWWRDQFVLSDSQYAAESHDWRTIPWFHGEAIGISPFDCFIELNAVVGRLGLGAKNLDGKTDAELL